MICCWLLVVCCWLPALPFGYAQGPRSRSVGCWLPALPFGYAQGPRSRSVGCLLFAFLESNLKLLNSGIKQDLEG